MDYVGMKTMQNRRFLREKILQGLYAYHLKGSEDALLAEKNLLNGSIKLYELYIRLAAIIVGLRDFAEQRIEEGKQKHFPTESEKNPNMRFVQNRFVEQLRADPVFIKKIAEYKILQNKQDDFFRNLYQTMIKYPPYGYYMDDTESTYEKDKAFICGLFKRKIMNNPQVFHHFDDGSCIYWAVDFNNVAFWLLRSLKNSEENNMAVLAREDVFTKPDDLRFAQELFERTVLNEAEFTPIIEQHLKNWEYDRTPIIDVFVIKMAMAELCHFPTIPVKVTLNEYIEIVKQYSTESSRVFINGLLNKLSEDFIQAGKIKKTGRGLISD